MDCSSLHVAASRDRGPLSWLRHCLPRECSLNVDRDECAAVLPRKPFRRRSECHTAKRTHLYARPDFRIGRDIIKWWAVSVCPFVCLDFSIDWLIDWLTAWLIAQRFFSLVLPFLFVACVGKNWLFVSFWSQVNKTTLIWYCYCYTAAILLLLKLRLAIASSVANLLSLHTVIFQ